MKYEREILSKLLDKFENSQQAWDITPEGRKPRKISLYVDKDPLFGEYWGEDCYLHRDDYLAAVKSLGRNGFVQFVKDHDSDLLKEVILVVDNVDKAFAFLKRERKRDRNLSDYDFVNQLYLENYEIPIAANYLSAVLAALKEKKTTASYFTTREELELQLQMVVAVVSQKEDILLRNFSKRNFRDSKVFERHGDKILSIFNKYGEIQYESFRALCEEFHILSNPEVAMVKGPLSFRLRGQTIDLKKLGIPFSFTSNAIEEMEIASVTAIRVITIENLTTFHYFDDPSSLVIYLGGYHNSAIRTFLLKLRQHCRASTVWLHTGDIDWGGFNILLDLRKKTSLPFEPYHMGIADLEKYRSECKSLTLQDKNNLRALAERPDADEFLETIGYMLEQGFKLEQESIEYDPASDFEIPKPNKGNADPMPSAGASSLIDALLAIIKKAVPGMISKIDDKNRLVIEFSGKKTKIAVFPNPESPHAYWYWTVDKYKGKLENPTQTVIVPGDTAETIFQRFRPIIDYYRGQIGAGSNLDANSSSSTPPKRIPVGAPIEDSAKYKGPRDAIRRFEVPAISPKGETIYPARTIRGYYLNGTFYLHMGELEDFEKTWHAIIRHPVDPNKMGRDGFEDYATKSILMEFGYSVAKNKGLTIQQRRWILKYIIDRKFATKYRVILYLEWFIRLSSKSEKMEDAVAKWQQDLKYVESI
jgi:hypothetical protein